MNVRPISFESLIDDRDDLERQNEKLRKIISALMLRVEQTASDRVVGYAQFERSIALEDEVRKRTSDLHEALDILNTTNARLAAAQRETELARQNLANAVEVIHEGFAIFDADENLVMQNSHFLTLLPDVKPMVREGTSFVDYVKYSASSKYIVFPDNMTHDEWVVHRLRMHERQMVNFILEVRPNFFMNVSEQRASDGTTIVLQTDVTDRVRLEMEERNKMLDEQAKIVKATLDHIDQAVMIFDVEGRLTLWNAHMREALNIPTKLWTKGTRLQRFAQAFQPDTLIVARAEPERILLWLRGEDKRRTLRKEIEMLNGQIFDVFGQVMPDGSRVLTFDNVTELRGLLRDLRDANEHLEARVELRTRELKDARDVAEKANASKTRFVAAASHDLLQPINAAKLYLSLLENTLLDGKQADIVSRTSQSFISVETMLGALLDISKLDSGAIALNISEFPLGAIFKQIENEFRAGAEQKGLDLRILPTHAIVESDPTYLRRIIQNLVSNAIRYTERGKILVGTKRRGNDIEIVVQDTGVGIAAEDQGRIFNEFHRLDPNQQITGAMGLGLSIVERAAANLGHALQLESELGIGTRFSIVLPLADRDEKRRQDKGVTPAISPDFDDLIVLVVENDAAVQNAMLDVLEHWGASPIGADSRNSAFAAIDALGLVPDVVIADYHLNDGDNGIEIIDEIRAKHGPFIAILLTADRDEVLEKRASSKGIFLRHKPVDINDLKVLLRKA